jgi:methylase of polypeptide subunit release factors
VRAALGAGSDLLSRSVDIPLHERRLEGREPLGTLIRLLVLATPVSCEAAARAFAPLDLATVETAGIVSSSGGVVRPLLRIVPHDDVLVASDRRLQPGEASAPDHVAGVHGPSLTLSHLTVRRPVASALDVGTGCGIQAILASRHAGRVVASDVNERALAFAGLNLRLNGVDYVELRSGSFFEPVPERYELLTCNPPYVISPESAYVFRDSGLDRDTVSRDVVREAPAHLEEGAFAHLLVSWVVTPGEHWSKPLREWLDGSGCDAWLLHNGTDDPLSHAGNWLRHEVGQDPEAYAAALDRWLAYFEKLGIEGIAAGAIVLRRRSGRNWIRADELPATRLRPAGEQIVRVFAAGDLLARLDDPRRLLGERLVLTPHARLEQRAVYEEREWRDGGIELVLDEGVGFSATLDPATARFLTELDGTRTLAEIAAELAREEGADAGSVDVAVVPVAAEMLAVGFLEEAVPHPR